MVDVEFVASARVEGHNKLSNRVACEPCVPPLQQNKETFHSWVEIPASRLPTLAWSLHLKLKRVRDWAKRHEAFKSNYLKRQRNLA